MTQNNLLFRQLFDPKTSTYTYLLADLDLGEALILDPVWEQHERDAQVIEELGLKLSITLETHIHADHVTGSDRLKKRFQCQSYVPENSEAEHVDHVVHDGDIIRLGAIELKAIHSPGHTDHHMAYLMHDRIFTGDALMIHACGRTDFQSGDAGMLFDTVTHKFFTLPEDTLVYPAHDYQGYTVSTIAEEKAFNPRFIDKTRDEFIQFMNNLNLDLPQRMIVSVPKNMLCANQDVLTEKLSEWVKAKTKVLNLGKDKPYDTVAMAKKMPCALWQILTFPEYEKQMNAWIQSLNLDRVPPAKTVSSFAQMQFKKEFDVIYAESLFDEMNEQDCIRTIQHMTQAIKEPGYVAVYAQFLDNSAAINQVIHSLLQGVNAHYGLKPFDSVNDWFSQHRYDLIARASMGAGFEFGVWGLAS